jgi:hypothetical protein
MIGAIILHYPPEADLYQRRMSIWLKPQVDRILKKPGKVRLIPMKSGWTRHHPNSITNLIVGSKI